MKTIDIEASLAAREQVKQAIAKLRENLKDNAHKIASTESAIRRLEHGHPPLDDLKAAILDHVVAWAEVKAKREVEEAVCELGVKREHGRDKPLTYRDALKMLPASDSREPNNLNALNKVLFGEKALYYYCRELVRPKLKELLDGLGPQHFSYMNVDSTLVGPGWSEREEQLTKLGKELEELQKQKNDIVDHLVSLGVARMNVWGA